MNTTTAAAITLSYNSNWAWVEAHAEGCRAAHRTVKYQPTDVSSPMPASEIREMQANPDEGHVKVHACARPLLKG